MFSNKKLVKLIIKNKAFLKEQNGVYYVCVRINCLNRFNVSFCFAA